MHDSRNYLKGALILTVAALVTKVLSAIYRVPFQNIVGDTGFYIYQQVYPFYGVLIALSTYGFPVIFSRMIAERIEDGDQYGVSQVLKTGFWLLLGMGLLGFSFLFSFAPFISKGMGDPHLTPLIQMVSISFLFLPFLSLWRGLFQGKGNMIPTAVSQVLEQIVRVVTILLLSYLAVASGRSLYAAGEGALFGSVTGGLTGMLVLFFFTYKEGMLKHSYASLDIRLMKEILVNGTFICISGMLLVLLQLVDAFSVYPMLLESGIDEAIAKIEKGVYDRGQPLIQLGTVVATSLSLTSVPLLSGAFKRGENREVNRYIILAIKVSIVIGSAAAVGLVNVIEVTNITLFSTNKGSNVLAVFVISILFSSIILTVSGVLHGIGKIYTPGIFILLGVVFKYACNTVLVPRLGTMGASIATVLALGLISACLVFSIRKIFDVRAFSKAFFIDGMIALFLMTLTIQAWLFVLSGIGAPDDRLLAVFKTFTSVAWGASIFALAMINSRIFEEGEIELLPLGDRLKKLQWKRER
ncbi:putative polysaccharide biosynthesis protein [Bacillus coahuilensis]|uniref:putative polysaccharide biosynthesis protein n=1 Tax=Bacillus coahuilensis TaxID=408580 RepID=UPI00018507F4|nr:polysaccharide biosynthesis protein [Bacillus coahuilensis]